MQTEITEIPPLKAGELSLVNCHSLLNIYGVLRNELMRLGSRLADDPRLFSVGLEECDRRIGRLRSTPTALADAAKIGPCHEIMAEDIKHHLDARPTLAADPEVLRSMENLRSAFWILQVRARELLARSGAPGGWQRIDIAELEGDFQEFLSALEENSHGRYRFVYNLAEQQPQDYYVDLKFKGASGTKIAVPIVFKDVMRDLIANARKYTAPGGQIRAALHSGSDGLRLVVQDTGRGIPAEELQLVMHPGRRGSNVADVRTMGGGFGLTKAFLVTRHFGGRFWIDSELGRGTTIRIWLPLPTGATGPSVIHE